MPQSHGTRRRTTVPQPRRSPEHSSGGARGPGPGGGDGSSGGGRRRRREGDGRPRVSKRRRTWRALTHNATITVAAVCALAAGVMLVDVDGVFGGGDAKPKAAANGDLSANDMLAMMRSSDMDPIAADSVAAAKQRAYEQHQRQLRELKEKAKRDAKARAKLKEQRERERLAKSNPSASQNQKYGRKMSALKGWGGCWSSLKTLWEHESGWNERAVNPSSGAYGIPQALPGSKLASAGKDWRTSSPTQIAWGLNYIKARYKDPCGAWAWWSSHHWY